MTIQFSRVMKWLQQIGVFFSFMLIAGCASATRLSVSPDEKVEHLVIEHQQPKAQAFSNVELALAEAYNDLPTVLKLKQPESGTFLLKPLIEYRIGDLGGGFHGTERARYTLKIIVRDNSIDTDFELGPNEPSGTWAPQTEVPKIKNRFRDIAAIIAKAVGGKLAEK